MNAFRIDTGRKLSIWNPKKKRRWWRKPVFDLYLMISDDWPTDKRTKKAAAAGPGAFCLACICPCRLAMAKLW